MDVICFIEEPKKIKEKDVKWIVNGA
jgi:hypothetical protein